MNSDNSASRDRSRVLLAACAAIVVGLQALVVWECAVVNPGKDWVFHAESAAQAVRPDGRYHGHPLYHVLVNAAARLVGAAGDIDIAAKAGGVICILAIAARVYFTDRVARELLDSQPGGARVWQRTLVLVVGAFASAAPNWWRFPQVYFGQFTANLWFNPTHILGQAFVAGFCWLVVRSRRTGLRDLWLASALLAISVAAKPNFAFACLPALGLLAVLCRLRWHEALVLGGPAAAVVGAVALAYKGDGTGSGVEWAPFLVWNRRTPTKVGSAFVSLAFPIAVRLLTPRSETRRWTDAAWTLMLIAIAQYALFAETGFRKFHANLEWGLHAAVWALVVASTADWCSTIGSKREPVPRWRHAAVAIALAAHLLGGAMHATHAYQGADWKP